MATPPRSAPSKAFAIRDYFAGSLDGGTMFFSRM
jgi:hypothetical protein